jgi:oligopeptide/dipeptide ABC transporter ATP-binding protein
VILRSPLGALSAGLILLLLLTATFAPIFGSDKASAFDTGALLEPASGSHPFGTDELGRDILWRILVATRLSIELALLSTGIGLVVGVVFGAMPTLLGKHAGRLVTTAVNIAVAFPGLLLVLFFAVIFGVGERGAVLALGMASAPFFARLMQTLSASVAGRDFIAAAQAAGLGRFRLLTRHILPNVSEPLVVNATVGAGNILLSFAALSFLGLGIQPPLYDWGRMLNGGLSGIYQNPLGALGPAAAIVIAGLAFNLFGEAAAQVLGVRTPPRLRKSPSPTASGGDSGASPPAAVLVAQDVHVLVPDRDGWARPVRGVSFTIDVGEAVGLVGESGSGKSLTALAVSDLIEPPNRVTARRLEFNGTPLTGGPIRSRRRVLGTGLAMVFQDPMTSFNPVMRIGKQLAEVSTEHYGLDSREAMDKAVRGLAAVRVPDARRRARQYPHEFSGGMRQRAMIAMGLMGTPRLIIADEPTTALDVTVQRQVLRLLEQIRREQQAALLLISHDIALVERTCDRVLVMYAGRIVEELPAEELYDKARHPYTRALLAAVPDMDSDRARPMAVIPGRPPAPRDTGLGCAFADRCSFSGPRCSSEDPVLSIVSPLHAVACWHPQATQ